MTTLRLFLHVTSGTIWVFAAAGLLWVNLNRGDALRPAGDALASVASVALATVLATGIWSVMASGGTLGGGEHSALLTVKLLAALVSFSASWMFNGSDSPRARTMWGATVVGTGLVALYLGVALDAAESVVTGIHS